MRRALAGALLATAAAALLLVGGAGPVAAHTETGTFSATRAEPSTDGTYTIDLLLTYDNDGHGAEGAALTVTVQGPTGGPVPVAMAPGDRAGAYTGDVAAASAISEDGFVARIGMLQGRVGQAVKVREIFVYPRQIEDLVLQSSALHRAQGVVSRQGHRDVIDLHVMFGSAGTPELEADLRDRFKQLTRLRFDSLVLLGADAALPDDAPWLVDHRHG